MEAVQSCYVEALCLFHAPRPNWWYEVCVDDPEEDRESIVVQSDGMFAEMEGAIAAGREWAAENGYAVREIEHGEEAG